MRIANSRRRRCADARGALSARFRAPAAAAGSPAAAAPAPAAEARQRTPVAPSNPPAAAPAVAAPAPAAAGGRSKPAARRRSRFRAPAAAALAVVVALATCLPAPALAALAAPAAPATSASATPTPATPLAAAEADVPWVVGMTVGDAKSALTAAGFGFSVEGATENSASVVNQSVVGRAELGTTVVITGETNSPTIVEAYVGYVDPDTGDYIQYPDAAVGQVPVIKTKGGQIELLASVRWSTGTGGYASDSGNSVTVTWESSDPSIATVDSRGIVTAVSDGTVSITCTTQQYGTVSASIDVRVVAQDGAYVTYVAVTDENGTPYGDNRIIFTEDLDGTQWVQLYVLVLYSDGTTKSTAAGDVIDGVTWSVSNSDLAYINESTGRMRPEAAGSFSAQVSVAGGLDGPVTGLVYVTVDNAQAGEYIPADTLTVRVVYNVDGEEIEWSSHTYDVASFSALGLSQQAYTQVKMTGEWQTTSASGVYVTTMLEDLGIDADNISQYYFTDTLGMVRRQVTASRVSQTGYYFPDFEAGLTTNAQPVQAMIAVAASSVDNSATVDYSNLNESIRFRLCVGSTSSTDPAAYYSLYCIQEITILMSGSPPYSSTSDPEGDGSGGDGGGSGGGDGGGPGGSGGGDGGADGSGSGTEGDGSGGGGEGDGIGSGSGDWPTEAGSGGEGDGISIINADAAGASGEEGAAGGSGDEGGSGQSSDADAEGSGGGTGRSGWSAFEMLTDDTTAGSYNLDNPLIVWIIPAVLAMLAAGGVTQGVRFRKECAA